MCLNFGYDELFFIGDLKYIRRDIGIFALISSVKTLLNVELSMEAISLSSLISYYHYLLVGLYYFLRFFCFVYNYRTNWDFSLLYEISLLHTRAFFPYLFLTRSFKINVTVEN